MKKEYGIGLDAILVLLAYSYSVNNYEAATVIAIALAVMIGAYLVEWNIERMIVLLSMYILQSVMYFSSDLAFNFNYELGLVACNSMFCIVLMTNKLSDSWFKNSFLIYVGFVVLCAVLPKELTCYLINGDPGFNHMILYGSFVFLPTVVITMIKQVSEGLFARKLAILK